VKRTLLVAGAGTVVLVPLLVLVPLVVVMVVTGRQTAGCTGALSGAPRGTAPTPSEVAAVPAEYAPLVARAAAAHGVSRAWLTALLQIESGWDPDAVSAAGALGLAQLLPGTAARMGVTDPLDPAQSIDGGARYLGIQFREFGSWDLASAAYNAGPGAVRLHDGIPPYAETQDYVAKVSALAHDFGADGTGGLLSCLPGAGEVPRIVGDTACPIGEPRHFTDTWGAPRLGGRSHKGVDIFADIGIPLYAYQAGTVRLTSSSLGGTSLWVTSDAGDAFYYAHLSGYAPGVASGARVEVGQVVGFNGNTGNARTTPPHLHWEVHPGGGDAVNPTPYAQAACTA
jgi:murein DD-endopeptidase MepM/ murein hydrolase activator NlpD